MDILVFAAVFAAGAAYILRPVLGGAREASARPGEASPERDALLAEKESAYEAITDLDFEYETGKLSDGDYAELRGTYRARALEVMARIEALDAGGGAGSAGTAASPPGTEPGCPACGKPTRASDHFCSACGSSLIRDDECAACGSPLARDDRYCAACGHRRPTNRKVPDAAAAFRRQEVLT